MAMVQERARLPCDVTSTLANDRVVLILWYRGSAGTPIYSFDARGRTIEKGKHWSDERLLGRRAYFKLLPGSSWGGSSAPGAHLELFPVQDRDEATYRCRVDFLLSPTKNTIVNFTVIIPPSKPEIYNESGLLVTGENGASIIGPYNEGSPLILSCKVTGGRPVPTVQWLVNEEVRPSEEVQEPGGVIKVTLVVQELSRTDLHAVFECRATNFNDSSPISSTVTLDMNFQPQNVTILSGTGSLSAGTDYELVCQAWGSRPAAIISWWKGGTTALKDAAMTTSPDSNVTTSILKYSADMTDSGKYLTCRAENQLIPQSAKEDGLKLNIFYKPVVTLQMGSNLDPETIKESDDVYFECHINANPDVQRVLWYHNGAPVEHRVTRGIILQNQTLVLQKITREAAGLYTCAAVNLEGEGESQPVNLRVMYKPYCRRHSKTIYGTALHEPASVTCEVEASPGPVTFRWTFNNTSEHLPIPASAVTSQDFLSVASYAPKSHLDYGTLLCWAFNDIGEQSVPCAFAIIAAGPPDPPKNCSIANQTTDTIEVECVAGFDGGLPQTFYMEVYDSTSGALHRNISSPEPLFHLTDLRPGLAFLMVTYAANSKGRSDVAKLQTFTLKVAEKRTGILIGVVLALILTALVVMVVMKMRRTPPSGDIGAPNDELKGDLENKPLNVGVLAARVKEGPSVCEAEDNDPDIIPHKTDVMSYQDYESIDRGGPGPGVDTVPSVRTLPRPHNQVPPGGSTVTYVELPLPRDAQPGYQVSATDLCLFAAKRKSMYLTASATTTRPLSTTSTTTTTTMAATGPSTASRITPTTAPTSPHPSNEDFFDDSNIYATINPVRGVDVPATKEPHIYATIEHSRRDHTPTTSTPIYATVDHRRSAYIPSTTVTHTSTTITRPRSVTNIPTVVSGPVPTANTYATIDYRRNANITTTNAPNAYVSSLHRLSLHSPSDYHDRRVTSRTPLLRSRTPPVTSHPQTTTSRSPLLRMANESAV
ncbi:uncharacterized protein LOC121870347 isoform X2 [Homarus americanus]|uniref:uncharacterized protein LOC121870347 isoform X2 n=1 Tax=Homarus americanus TaxID=6706 RepID=UPI001C44E35C|nr:uncharacterized protein LOC121870347 isoform X2 [Homarus americanus]